MEPRVSRTGFGSPPALLPRSQSAAPARVVARREKAGRVGSTPTLADRLAFPRMRASHGPVRSRSACRPLMCRLPGCAETSWRAPSPAYGAHLARQAPHPVWTVSDSLAIRRGGATMLGNKAHRPWRIPPVDPPTPYARNSRVGGESVERRGFAGPHVPSVCAPRVIHRPHLARPPALAIPKGERRRPRSARHAGHLAPAAVCRQARRGYGR